MHVGGSAVWRIIFSISSWNEWRKHHIWTAFEIIMNSLYRRRQQQQQPSFDAYKLAPKWDKRTKWTRKFRPKYEANKSEWQKN